MPSRDHPPEARVCLYLYGNGDGFSGKTPKPSATRCLMHSLADPLGRPVSDGSGLARRVCQRLDYSAGRTVHTRRGTLPSHSGRLLLLKLKFHAIRNTIVLHARCIVSLCQRSAPLYLTPSYISISLLPPVHVVSGYCPTEEVRHPGVLGRLRVARPR